MNRSAVALVPLAQLQLWRCRVSLTVGTWTGEPSPWALRLAPLTIPPFRSVILNCNGDFFAGTAANIASHSARRIREWARRCRNLLRDTVRDGSVRVMDIAGAYGLLAAAHLLRALSNPHRALFAKLHGKEALQVPARPLPPGTPNGVARYRQEGPDWNGEAFELLARSSRSRWLLWHDNGDMALTDHMLEPFEDEGTFAVSLQSHYRAWKPMLVPTAPFRAIQPGAATQVLAPLSHVILVDREKLLALRIPERGLSGTAWLILFWQAAAAGWRSYSTGQTAEIGEEPDFPVVETQFLLRLLCDRNLRRLTPAEPDLSRGNISFTPGLCEMRSRVTEVRRFSSGRPRVLVVSPFLPYPLSHGGAVRIYNLCRALSNRVDFALATFREKHDVVDYTTLHEIFEKVYVVDVDESPSQDPNLPRQVRHHQSRSLGALIARFAAQWKPNLLQVEYTHLAAFRDSAPQIPAILVEHDLTFTLYGQLADKEGSPAARREYELWRNFEATWLRKHEGVWTVSEEDRQIAIQAGSAPRTTFTIPNGVDTARYRPGHAAHAPEIFFVGSFRHLPNLLAFEKLRDLVMPLVWAARPDARLRVVGGPRHEAFWRGSREIDRRITVHGFVEDLRPLYARASIVVAPLEVSAGTNIKVLEAMACGKPVVSTPLGCAGLGLVHGYDVLIHGDWRDFAAAVSSLLSDPAARRQLGANARRTVEAGFSWTSIADRAFESYLQTASHLYRHRRAAG